MGRAFCVLAVLFGLFSWPGTAVGQNFEQVPGFPGASISPSFPRLGSFNIGDMRFTAVARVGYQWIGLNFNLPTLSTLTQIPWRPPSAPIDIQLRDAGVWTGAAGVEGRLAPWLSLFANAEANAKKDAGAVTSEEPLHLFRGGGAAYRWNASGLEWWALEGGIAVNVVETAALVAGLRRDHLSFDLDEPRDYQGNPINQVYSFPGRLITFSNAADCQFKLWVPYVGLRVVGPNYRASVIWSPFADAAVKIPDRFLHNDFSEEVFDLEHVEWRYSMFQAGGLFEGQFEYDVRFSSNLFVSVWAKGSWLGVRGTGNLDQNQDYFISWGYATNRQSHQSATATLSRTLIAVGLSAVLEF